MSGAEIVVVIDLAAFVVQLIDVTQKVIDRVKEYRRDSAFDHVLSQLKLFHDDIVKAQGDLGWPSERDAASERTFVRVLDGCNSQIAALDDLITRMTSQMASSTLRRTWMGLRSLGKDVKIREIMAILDRYKATLMLHMVMKQIYTGYS